MKKLLLCSGPPQAPYGMDGWFRVDSNPACKPDLVASLPPVPYALRDKGPWDIIGLIHGIEHFYQWEAVELVRACWEMLAPGGQLILEQPNLEKCVKFYNSPQGIMGIYGDQSWKEPCLAHRYGYTPESLTEVVTNAGFARAVLEPAQFHRPGRDFRLVAIR